MWKVQSLIDELNHRAKKHWITGKAIDEQTIGFREEWDEVEDLLQKGGGRIPVRCTG
jgi:hypothetical protein